MKYLLSIAFSMLLAPFAGAAQPAPPERVYVGDWGIELGMGYAAIDNPLTERHSFESYLLPQWYYYGERLYVENTEVGYALYESDRLILDALGYFNQDGLLFNTDNQSLSFLDVSDFIPRLTSFSARAPVELEDIDRKLTYMAGLNATIVTDWFDIRVRRAIDVSAGHNGVETSFALSNQYRVGDFRFFWELGSVFKDAALNNYYYGIRAEESGSRNDTLITDKTLADLYIKAALTYRLSDNLSAILSLNQTWLHKDLLDSPLLDDRHYMSGFVGVNYHF